MSMNSILGDLRSVPLNSLGRSSSLSNYQFVSSSFTEPIDESVEYDFQNPSRPGRMSKQEIKEMTRDVQQLRTKMSSIIINQNLNSINRAQGTSSSFINNLSRTQFPFCETTNYREPSIKNISSQKNTSLAKGYLNSSTTFDSHKKVSSIKTAHSITDLNKTGNAKLSFEAFDREVAYEKEKIQHKSLISSLEFENENLKRELQSAKRRVDGRDQEIVKMKQRIMLLEETKQKINEKERNWKNQISNLEHQLVQARMAKNDLETEEKIQERTSQFLKLKYELRKSQEVNEDLEEKLKLNSKKLFQSSNCFNDERLEYIGKIRQLERQKFDFQLKKQSDLKQLIEETCGLKQKLLQQALSGN